MTEDQAKGPIMAELNRQMAELEAYLMANPFTPEEMTASRRSRDPSVPLRERRLALRVISRGSEPDPYEERLHMGLEPSHDPMDDDLSPPLAPLAEREAFTQRRREWIFSGAWRTEPAPVPPEMVAVGSGSKAQ